MGQHKSYHYCITIFLCNYFYLSWYLVNRHNKTIQTKHFKKRGNNIYIYSLGEMDKKNLL